MPAPYTTGCGAGWQPSFCRGGCPMRFSSKAAIVLWTGVAAVGLAIGQQPGGKGFGGGFAGGGQQQDPAALLRHAQVRKELKLTDEQLEKVPDAVMKGLADVLNADQL